MASITITPPPPRFQMLGCLGKHGPYTFYKSIKAGDKVYSLSQFIPVKVWPDSAMLNIADIQLLWSDKSESFCSLKLYFLPENTPDGRLKQHGEDELIALQHEVIIRAADLLSIVVEEKEWDWGFKTPPLSSTTPLNTKLSRSFVSEPNVGDKLNGTTSGSIRIIVLSYPRYIRLRTILKRLEGTPDMEKWMTNPLVLALGLLNIGPNCKVLYAKESFDHPDLEDNEMFCNHLAPKLKGRKRKRLRKRHPSGESASSGSVSSSGGSVGSSRENDLKSLNGLNTPPKLEGLIKTESPTTGGLKESSKPGRRGSGNNGSAENHIVKIEGGKSSWGQGSRRRTNGLSNNTNDDRVKLEPGAWMGKGNKAQLLGPGLTELAQKLERSNALQILPIRPSQEEDEDNHQMPRKKRKTDIPIAASILSPLQTGPYHMRPVAIPPPGDNLRMKKLHEQNSGGNKVLIPAHTVPLELSKITRADPNWKPLTLPLGCTPCPFVAGDKIYCDPYDNKKIGVGLGHGDGTRPHSSSSSLVKGPPNSNETSSSVGGVRLTSEVTLFPSKGIPSYPSALDGVMQHSFANPRASANAALANSKPTPEIDIQPWKPSSSTSSRSYNPGGGVKEQVTAKKQPSNKGANANNERRAQQQHQQQQSSHGHTHSQGPSSKPSASATSTSSSSGSRGDRDRERKEAEKAAAQAVANANMANVQNSFMHPYFGKVDPAYLHLLANAPFLMPPPPPQFMQIPGAVEQFYKDFFLQSQALPPGFPTAWFPPGGGGGGDNRGPKS